MDWLAWAAAWVAAIVAAAAFVRSVRSDRASKRWREAQEIELRATRADWTEAFKRMAAALEQLRASAQATTGPPPQEALLSARLSSASHPDDRLIVMNLGPGSAQLLDVQVPNDPEALVQPTGVSTDDPVELYAGEEHTMVLALSMASPSPLEVWLQWRDDTNDVKERTQKFQ